MWDGMIDPLIHCSYKQIDITKEVCNVTKARILNTGKNMAKL